MSYRRVHIGQTVYVIYGDGITKVQVEMLGKTAFAHSLSFNECMIEEFRRPCEFEEEGERWFRNLNDAKRKLRQNYPKCRIRKIIDGSGDDHWRVVDE